MIGSGFYMKKTGTYGWLFQRVTGLALFALIMVHFGLMHYMGPEKRMYADVVRRLSNPLWKTFDLLILTLALYHGLNGLWGIVEDYVGRASLRVGLLVAIVTLGAVLFGLGSVTILSVAGG